MKAKVTELLWRQHLRGPTQTIHFLKYVFVACDFSWISSLRRWKAQHKEVQTGFLSQPVQLPHPCTLLLQGWVSTQWCNLSCRRIALRSTVPLMVWLRNGPPARKTLWYLIFRPVRRRALNTSWLYGTCYHSGSIPLRDFSDYTITVEPFTLMAPHWFNYKGLLHQGSLVNNLTAHDVGVIECDSMSRRSLPIRLKMLSVKHGDLH